MASWRGAAAAQQIKYLDTGAVLEGLIELPALPDEITGYCRYRRREDVPTAVSTTLGASMS